MEIVQEISKFETICHTRTFNKTSNNNVLMLHWHERYELCQVLENDCSFRVDGKIVNASVGDIVAINEQLVHQFIIKEDNTKIRICQLPTKLLLNFGSSIRPLKIHITAEEISQVESLGEKLNALFDIMEQEKKNGFVANDHFQQSLVTALYFLLERHFPETENAFSGERDRQEFYRIIEYVNSHYAEDINVEQIAKQLYLSRMRLTAVFKKYAGEGVNEYINKLRIKNANYMLSKGATITEAAFASGFQSIRTFNNIYRKVMNMTPTEYVRENK